MKLCLIALSPILLCWLVTFFGETELRVRYDGRDHYFLFGYGRFYSYWHAIPEEWFEFDSAFVRYLEDQNPNIWELLFAPTPYPRLTLNEPSTMDGFEIPFWNIVILVIFLWYLVMRLIRLKRAEELNASRFAD